MYCKPLSDAFVYTWTKIVPDVLYSFIMPIIRASSLYGALKNIPFSCQKTDGSIMTITEQMPGLIKEKHIFRAWVTVCVWQIYVGEKKKKKARGKVVYR